MYTLIARISPSKAACSAASNYNKDYLTFYYIDLSAEVDDVDRGILKLLQDNARVSSAEMAKRLHVAESTVRYRFRRLLENKTVTRITALIDPRKIGLNVTAVVLVKVDPLFLNEAIEGLAFIEEVHHVFQTTGEYDVVAVAHVKDMDRLNGLKQRIKMIRGVRDVTMWIATRLVKIETRFNVF